MRIFTRKWWLPTSVASICAIAAVGASTWQTVDMPQTQTQSPAESPSPGSAESENTPQKAAAETTHVDALPAGLRGLLYDINHDGVLDYIPEFAYNFTDYYNHFYISDETGYKIIEKRDWYDTIGGCKPKSIHPVYENIYAFITDYGLLTFRMPDLELIDYVKCSNLPSCDFNNDGRTDFLDSYGDTNDVYTITDEGKILRNKLSAVDIKDLIPQDDSESQTGGCGFITMDFSMLSAGYLYSQMFAGGSTQSGSAIGENTFRATDINGDGLTDMVNFQSGKIFYNLGEGGRYCTDTFNGSMFFADFNGDGLDDYVLYSDNNISTNLVKADGTVTSKNVISGFTCANIWCRDVDRDGDPDLVLSLEGSQNFMVILENDGKGSFRRREYAIDSTLKDFKYCIDYDNDGNYEILNNTKALKITGTKIDVNPIDLLELTEFPEKCSVREIFVNPADGKVYLIPTSGTGMLDYCIPTKANTAPSAPSDAPEFVYEASTGLLKITWKRGSDAETPVNDLTYSLRIGTTPGADDIMSADALANGTRLSATEGNNGNRLQRIMDTSSWPEGTYYIAVQSVDGNYMGSTFSKEAVFEKKEPQCAFSMHYTDVFAINDILTLKTTTPKSADLSYNWNLDGGVITGENPEKGEIYVTFAEPGTKAISLQITGANGNSSRTFSREIEVSGVPFHNSLKVKCATKENEEPHFMAALDLDEDGQMEPFYRYAYTPNTSVYGFMSGDENCNYDLIPKMFNNNNLISKLGGDIGTFDINGDGLCDYVATDADSWRRKILATNLGELDMDFEQVTTDLNFSRWVDFDNDGKYDGAEIPQNYHSYYFPIYRNDGDYKSFKSKQLQTYAVLYDFNNDGLLDVIGDDDYEWIGGVVSYKHWIYLNNGDFTCTKYKELGEPYGYNGSRNVILYIDDFDNNGKYDILYYNGKKTILQWDDGTSTELPVIIENAQDFSIFDYDNNGYPDIIDNKYYKGVISFYPGRQFELYTFKNDEYETDYSFYNNKATFRLSNGKIGTAGVGASGAYGIPTPSTQLVNVTNEAPTAPTAVRHSQNERFVVIEWDHSTDKETPATQMRYNLSVKHKGMEGEGAYVFSPANSGKNGVPVPTHKPLIRGNRFSIPIANIPAGEYEVKVQGVDLMHDCSDFSETYYMTVAESALIDMQPSGEVDIPVTVKVLVNTATDIDFDGGRQTAYASGEYTVVWDTPGVKTVTVNGTESKIHIQPAPDGSFTAPAVVREGDRIILKGKLMDQGSWYVKRTSGGKATYANFFSPDFRSGSLTQIDESTAEMVLNSRYAYGDAEIVHTVYSEFSEREYSQPVSRAYNPSTEATPQLRYVTADGISGKYKLQWTLPGEIREEATGVNVYRETSVSGKYELMATLPLSATEYVDMASTPDIVASRYVISYVLTYGESAYSNPHQPVHVMINRGAGSSWNLIWGKYEGGTIPQYRILRGPSPEALEVIATVSGNMTSYTDFTAPTSGALYYAVETELNPSASYAPSAASRAATRAPRSNVVAAAGGNIAFVESITVISADGNTTLSAEETAPQSIRLQALINPTSATFSRVNWIVVSGDDLVTVDQQGTVRPTGNGNGTATVRAMSVDGSGKYADIDIRVSGYSGIEAVADGSATSGHLTAWPSPAITEITIGGLDTDGGELYIFSLGSQIMYQEKTSETNATIDCSLWAPGVYIAKQGSHTVKFIKR